MRCAIMVFFVSTRAMLAQEKSLETFGQRRDHLINQIVANPTNYVTSESAFFIAQACFLRNMDEEGKRIAEKGFKELIKRREPTKTRAVDFFQLWPAMVCFYLYHEKFSTEIGEAWKKHLTSIDCYSYGYTANLNMVMWTTKLLGEQLWGETAFVPQKRDTTSHYKANPDLKVQDRLMSMVTRQAETGGEEYASRPYGAMNLAPILCLAQYARDPALKKRAQFAHDVTLARYAPFWLEGHLIMTSRRSYPDLFNDPVGITEFLWPFYGGGNPPRAHHHALKAAIMGGPAHPLIVRAARERSAPFMSYSRFEPGANARQVSWITSSYGLFCEFHQNNPRPFGQTYPFGVRWLGGTGGWTMLWFSVPVNDEAGLSASHPSGFDPYVQSVCLNGGSLLYMVDTQGQSRKAKYGYGKGFVPGGYEAVINEAKEQGRFFLKYADCLIAFQASKPFEWDPKAKPKYMSGTLREGDSVFRVHGPVFAAVIETAQASEYIQATAQGTLDAFRLAVMAISKLQVDTAKRTATYTDAKGKSLRRVLGGEIVQGERSFDFPNAPLAESPFVHQKAKNEPLVVTDGKKQLIFEFTNWNIKDAP